MSEAIIHTETPAHECQYCGGKISHDESQTATWGKYHWHTRCWNEEREAEQEEQ